MQTINWQEPENLKRLLTASDDELRQYYHWVDWESLKRTRRKYRAKLRRLGEMENEPRLNHEQEPNSDLDKLAKVFQDAGINIAAEDLEGASRAGFHVGFIRNAEGEIEYTKPLPNVQFGKRKQQALNDFISQADPVTIKPSKAKKTNRDYKMIVVFGDSQIEYRSIGGEMIPIHDEAALDIVRQVCKTYQPETIVNLGDTIDLAALSRFAPDSDHFRHSLNPAFNRVHKMYADLRADSPNSEIHEVDSNHNTRLGKFILNKVPELYGIRQAGTPDTNYPTLTYPFFANLDAVNVKWHSGYGAATYVYGNDYQAPPIVFKHGNSVVSNGSTAAKESKENPETHLVRGHGHRMETHYRTTRAGLYLASIMVGCTCRVDGLVPSYGSAVDDYGIPVPKQENWQQGILIIRDYENGDYQFDHLAITRGVAYYNGKEFDGTLKM